MLASAPASAASTVSTACSAGFAAKPAEKAVDETVGALGEGAGSSAVLRAALHRLGPDR